MRRHAAACESLQKATEAYEYLAIAFFGEFAYNKIVEKSTE